MPELDFVLEMAARDEPDKWTFIRAGNEPFASVALATWDSVLSGRLKLEYYARTGISRGNDNVRRYQQRHATPGAGFRLGLSRGGKSIDGKVLDDGGDQV